MRFCCRCNACIKWNPRNTEKKFVKQYTFFLSSLSWMTSQFTFSCFIASQFTHKRPQNERKSRTGKSWKENCAVQMIVFSKLMIIDRIEWNRNNNYEAIDFLVVRGCSCVMSSHLFRRPFLLIITSLTT